MTTHMGLKQNGVTPIQGENADVLSPSNLFGIDGLVDEYLMEYVKRMLPFQFRIA